ncbi:MOSC domain-containing protein [Halioxenophilus aromaticivorans]|uniref:MOSC domain-containing protein n=1 Tax=Halioxenophilus aromaticivorans TaxID=1306992 RepID=A0AAV3TYK2_9ALTE
MELISSCQVTRSSGLERDLRGKPGKRQVTLLSRPAWRTACQELDREGLPWTTRRANLLIEGLEFGPEDVGAIVEVGKLRMQITRETDPCHRMDEQAPGLKQALTPDWRGGVCCRVIEDGTVRLGDAITVTA